MKPRLARHIDWSSSNCTPSKSKHTYRDTKKSAQEASARESLAGIDSRRVFRLC